MGSELAPDLTADMVTKAIGEISKESELAALFAIVDNKAWWIEDDEYDYDEGTMEHQQAKEKSVLWFSLQKQIGNGIFEILRTEGTDIPETGQITVLEPFMKRNGYINGNGWWIKA